MKHDTIWKFPLKVLGEQTISMPAGAKILSVDCQHDVVAIWAKVNSEAILAYRKVWVIGTGHKIPDGLGRFVGTCQMMSGALIWHVFIED